MLFFVYFFVSENVVMIIVISSNCATFNKSVEVAQGLTTFLNLVYLGLKGGWGKWANYECRNVQGNWYMRARRWDGLPIRIE